MVRRSKSMSFTRRRMPSSTRMPVAYSRPAISHRVPSSHASSATTSASESTTGTRAGRFARTIPSIHGSALCNTSL